MTCSSNTTCPINRRARLALTLLALLGLAAPLAAADGRIAALRRGAEAALDRHDPIAAEVALRSAIRAGVPADALRAWLGQALLARGDRAEARRVLGEGGFTPDSAEHGWRVKGQLELSEGHLPAAAQAFDRALKIDPADADLWVQIASLRFTGGEQAQAIEAAERAVTLDPANPRALALRGLLIREQYGLAASLPWFEEALRVRPDDAALLGEYAATLGDMGKYRAMLTVCRKLAEVDPKNPRPLFLQAVLAARAGKVDLARATLLRTGNAFRDMPAAILLNGVLEYRAGNVNLAVELFGRLARMQPDNLQVRLLLARALARQGDWLRLAREFDSDARQAYAAPYLLRLVAQAQARGGDRARAAAYAARALHPGRTVVAPLAVATPLGVLATQYQDTPNFASAAVPYVRGLLAAGQREEAQVVADRLRDANPGAAEANLLAGDVRLLRGDARGALVDYGNGASIRFNEPVLRRMDAALRAQGRSRDADAMTSRYLAQNPASLVAMKLLAAGWAAAPAGKVNPARSALVRALTARGQMAPSR